MRVAPVGDRSVVLDLRNGVYLQLDHVATAMWSSLASAREAHEIVAEISARFAEPRERVWDDFRAFRERVIADGLFVEPPAHAVTPALPPRRLPPARFPEIAAWRALSGTARALRTSGFANVYADCLSLPSGSHPNERRLASALAAFRRAEHFYIHPTAPADCLPRSLGMFRYLRRMDIGAEHVIAVRGRPFFAHAWVEVEGRVILDRAPSTDLTPIARIPA